MKNSTVKSLICLICLIFTFHSNAQSKNAISGKVKGCVEAVNGAEILITHRPTGIEFTTRTDADGNFEIDNLRVGGPYLVAISASEYESYKTDNIFLKFGDQLQLSAQLEAKSKSACRAAIRKKEREK